jgi:2,3-bisphosphoglycerate-dependent phosphoglycerate mutase
VFSSDLRRAADTAAIAFGGSGLAVLHDWRLRGCDHGELSGSPAAPLEAQRARHVEVRYPGGESWSDAVTRVGRFLHDLPLRCPGSGCW